MARETIRELARAEPNRVRGLCLEPVIARAQAVDFEAFLDALGATHPELMAVVARGQVRTRDFYPISWFRALHGALRAISGGLEEAHRVGIESTTHDFTRGIFRSLTKIVSPGFLMERAATVFRYYGEHGRLVVKELRDGEIEARFTDCRGYDEAIYCDLMGGCEGALLACGAREVGVEVVSGGRDGDEHLTIRVRWR